MCQAPVCSRIQQLLGMARVAHPFPRTRLHSPYQRHDFFHPGARRLRTGSGSCQGVYGKRLHRSSGTSCPWPEECQRTLVSALNGRRIGGRWGALVSGQVSCYLSPFTQLPRRCSQRCDQNSSPGTIPLTNSFGVDLGAFMVQMGYIYYNPSRETINLWACAVNGYLNFVSSHLQLICTQMAAYNLTPPSWFPLCSKARKSKRINTLNPKLQPTP